MNNKFKAADTVYRYGQYNVLLYWARYQGNGRRALELIDEMGETVYRVTVNIIDEPLADNCSFIKTWMENEGMLDWLIRNGLAGPTGRVVQTGHVEAPEVQWLVALS